MALLDDIIRQVAQTGATGIPSGLSPDTVVVPPYPPPGSPPSGPPKQGDQCFNEGQVIQLGTPGSCLKCMLQSPGSPTLAWDTITGNEAACTSAPSRPPPGPVPFPPPLGPPIPPPGGTPPPSGGGQTWNVTAGVPGAPPQCMDASCKSVPCGPSPTPGFPPGCGGTPPPPPLGTPPPPGSGCTEGQIRLNPVGGACEKCESGQWVLVDAKLCGGGVPPPPPPGPVPFPPPVGPPIAPPGGPSIPPGNVPGFALGAQPFSPVQFPLWVYGGQGGPSGNDPQQVPYGTASPVDWKQISSFPGTPAPPALGGNCAPDGTLKKAANGSCLVCSVGKWILNSDQNACPASGPIGGIDVIGTTCDTPDDFKTIGKLCFHCNATTLKWESAPFKNCQGGTTPPPPPLSGGGPVAGGACTNVGEVLGDGTSCFICDSTKVWRMTASKNCQGTTGQAVSSGSATTLTAPGTATLTKAPATATAGSVGFGGSASGTSAFGSIPGISPTTAGTGIAPTFDEMVQNILKGSSGG
jgi:hypothetical protein